MENRQKSFPRSAICVPSLIILICVCLATTSFSLASGKRFDCRMFCKETGFHGMVGGCRCSFTLFTAKRAIRNPAEDFAKLTLGKPFQQNPIDAQVEDSSLESSDESREDKVQPLSPRFRFMKYVNLDENSEAKPIVTDYAGKPLVYAASLLKKRRELEQDLDNGETTDFLRSPY